MCQCTALFTGTTCEVPLTGSPCTSNPCINGGRCEVRNNGQTYFCNCPPGEYSATVLHGLQGYLMTCWDNVRNLLSITIESALNVVVWCCYCLSLTKKCEGMKREQRSLGLRTCTDMDAISNLHACPLHKKSFQFFCQLRFTCERLSKWSSEMCKIFAQSWLLFVGKLADENEPRAACEVSMHHLIAEFAGTQCERPVVIDRCRNHQCQNNAQCINDVTVSTGYR